MSELCPFLRCHSQLTFLGLVLTEACKEEIFTDISHEDFDQSLGKSLAEGIL